MIIFVTFANDFTQSDKHATTDHNNTLQQTCHNNNCNNHTTNAPWKPNNYAKNRINHDSNPKIPFMEILFLIMIKFLLCKFTLLLFYY